MHTLNVRLASICLVVILVLGGGIHLLHGTQVWHSAKIFRDKSAREEKDGKPEEAIRLLANYVALMPSDHAEQVHLGMMLADRAEDEFLAGNAAGGGDARSAFFNLEEGLRASDSSLSPEIVDKARRKLVKMALPLRRASDAETHLGLLLKDSPDDPELLDLYGQALFGKGDDKGAEDQFRKAIAKAPTQIDAYRHLSDLLRTRLNRKDDADQVMHDMVYCKDKDGKPVNANSVQARQFYARYLQVQGKTDDAFTEAKRVLEIAPENLVGLWLAGWCCLSNGQSEAAEGYLRRGLAVICFQEGNWDEGLKLLAEGSDPELKSLAAEELASKPVTDEQRIARGDAWWNLAEKANGKAKEAMRRRAGQSYQNALSDKTPGPTRAKVEKRLEELAEALQKLRSVDQKDQNTHASVMLSRDERWLDQTARHEIYLLMASVKTSSGHRDKAIAILKQGLEATKGTPINTEILFQLVEQCVDERQFSEAEQYLKELREIKDAPNLAPLLGFVDAQLALAKNGDQQTAKATLLEIVSKLNHAPVQQKLAFFYLGDCYQQEGNPEQAILAYSQAVKIDPYFYAARSKLADIFLGHGNVSEAAEQYRMATRAPRPALESSLGLARTWIMMMRREDKAKRDWERVDSLLHQIKTQIQDQPQAKKSLGPHVAELQAEVLLANDDPKAAEAVLRDAAKEFPKSPIIWRALINLSMHRADQAIDQSEKERFRAQATGDLVAEESNLGDRAVTREARASLASRRKDPQLAALLKSLGEGEVIDKMSAGEKTQLWTTLGLIANQTGNLELAGHYWRQVAKLEPTNIPIGSFLCELDLKLYEKGQTPDVQELDTVLNGIEHAGGRGPFWLYGKAIQALVKSKNTDPQLLLEARGYLKDAMEIRKDWSAPVVLAGKICELQDEPDRALDFYARAIYRMEERDNDVIRRTVHLMLPRGHVPQAKLLFDYLEQQKSPLLGEMHKDFTYVKVFTGNFAEALKDVENSVSKDCPDYKEFLRQGQLYGYLVLRLRLTAQAQKRDPKSDPQYIPVAQRAVNSILKARELNPQADEVWIALVQLLVDIGQPEKVKPLLADAAEKLKGVQAFITLATCYEKLKEPEKALAKYEEAEKAAPQNSHVLRKVADFYVRSKKIDQAESLLRQIIAMQTPATFTDTCWARQQEALILKDRGDFDHLCQGEALIEENLRSNAASIEDRRLKVEFLTADPRKEKLDEAIAAMEEVVKGADATPKDNFVLAQLYMRKNDWNGFVKQMHGVLGAQRDGVPTAYLVYYVDALLQKKELEDADNWLKALEKAAPDLFDTVRLRAEYKFLHGEPDAAGDLAMGFLFNSKAQPSDRGQQLLLVAQVMEKFASDLASEGKNRTIAKALAEKAGELYATLRNKKVSEMGELHYAGYLARQKRIRDFLEVLEQCWEQYPTDALLLPSLQMIESKSATQAQYQQLEKILVAASKKTKGSVTLLLVLAKLHSLQQQNDKALADYREILAQSPRHFETMNNLAVGLARSGQNLDEALKLINDALAISGPRADVLDSRAIIHIARKEYDEALNDAQAAVKYDGTGEEYFHLAWANSLAGKKSDAATAFTEATKRGLDRNGLDPSEIPVYERLKDGF